MKHVWINNEEASELLIFCNGWGMDAATLSNLEISDGLDVLNLFDYTIPDIDLDIACLTAGYDKVSLVAWSLGVWAAAELFYDSSIKFETATAVAGTLEPYSDDYGIPVQIFEASMRQWNFNTRRKFERRIYLPFANQAGMHFVSPERYPGDQCNELMAIRARMDDVQVNTGLFTHALVCCKDRIIPGRAQFAAWRDAGVKIIERPWPHYPFYNFESWRDLLDLIEKS